ncbi:MAG: LCP family protein [Solirubrobacteraceae bacterium]|nr:LCP family protein [Solirubrobacteraceae bacterium]
MSTPRRYWPRYVGALALVVLLMGASTAFAAIRFGDCLVIGCDQGTEGGGDTPEPLPPGPLDPVEPGEPQTLLLIGSDGRSKKSVDGDFGAHSDTMMLAHLDADRGAAVMSIPRDTEADVPGYGPRKINEAFTLGGSPLTVKTVKGLLGIDINHVVEIDFEAFQRSVNELGCLHQDIDRSYFNDNSTGTNYAAINVRSGYQLVCGGDTLDWVRFRHTDNDLVRGARQQEFLRSAKAQVAFSRLLSSGNDLVKIFRRYTRTDITKGTELLTLMKLAVEAGKHDFSSVRFRASDQPGTSNLAVSQTDLAIMRREFQRLEGSRGPTTSPKAQSKGKTSSKTTKQSGALATGLTKVASETTKPELTEASFKLAAGKLPVYYPSVRLAVGGYAQRDPVRAYDIRPTRFSKRRYPAFRLTYSAGEGKYFGQYYGVQGTTWKDAPILRTAHDTVERRGRKLQVYRAGSRIRTVAWVTPSGAYWVSNSLSLALTNSQMLDIAASLRRVPG